MRVSLTPSLPGRMPGSLARDARPTFAPPTCSGLDVPSDAQWVGRLVRCRAASRAALLRCEMRGSSRESRDRTHHIARATICVSLTPSLPGRMPGSLARDARPTWSGLDVPSDAGRRPAPPCYGQGTTVVPRVERPNAPHRESNNLRFFDAIAPRQDAGEPRAGRATHSARDPL